ncbi:MAG: hypothetical protein RLZZ312_1143 [Bacteroidota bacterium]|jgi:hypothetical protein
MEKYSLHERILEQKDWAIILFLVVFALIAIVKTNFENRFNDFIRLLVSDKYAKIYRDGSLIMSWFTVILFFVQLFSISFFIQLALHAHKIVDKTDFIVYIQIFVFVMIFILSKFLVEKIIATTFDEEDLVEQYNMLKINYRTYISMLLLPVNIYLFYSDLNHFALINCIIIIISIAILITYSKSIKVYQNFIISNLIYFILYLCTLEIAPYYFVYYWFAKS